MRSVFKNLIIASIIISNAMETNACGPSLFTDQSRFSVFSKNIISEPSFAPFQYTHDKFDIYNADEIIKAERTQNVNEWKNTAMSATFEDIYAVQYNMDEHTFLTQIKKANPDNTFIQWLKKPIQKAYLDYMLIAKKMESLQDGLLNDWDDLYSVKNLKNVYDIGNKSIPLINAQSDKFLKERYAFQAVKAFYYQNLYGKKITDKSNIFSVYKDHLANSNSVVAQWAILYYAGLQDDPKERVNQLALAFDASKEKRFRAYKLISSEDLDWLGSNVSNKKLSEIYFALSAIRTPGRAFEYIEKIYALNTESKYLPLLINREVNKIEDWIWSPKVLKFHPELKTYIFYREKYDENRNYNTDIDTGYGYYALQNLKSDIDYGKKMAAYIRNIQVKNPAEQMFFNLATAHLYNVIEDPQTALSILNKLKVPEGSEYDRQFRTDMFIATVNTHDISSEKTKELLAQYLAEYNTIFPPKPFRDNENYNYDYARSYYAQILAYLGRAYLNKGERFAGIMLLNNSEIQTNDYHYQNLEQKIDYSGMGYLDQYALPADIDTYLALKQKNNYTQFEKLLIPKIWIADEMVWDLKGTLQARLGDYEAALVSFNKLNDAFWEKNYEFAEYLPQQSVTYLGNILPIKIQKINTYQNIGKKEITHELVHLRQAIQTEKDNAKKAHLIFNLANAEYNISYYGKAWMYRGYGKSDYTTYSFGYEPNWSYYSLNNSGSNNMDNYYGLNEAIKLYQSVINLTNDAELKAQAITMLAHCDELQQNYRKVKSQPSITHYNPSTYKSQYWNQLASLNHTQSYKTLITACPDVRKAMK